MRSPTPRTALVVLTALLAATLLPSAPAAPLPGLRPSDPPATGAPNGTLSLAIAPAHVTLASANATATYTVSVTNHATGGNASRTVDLTVVSRTSGWTLTLNATTLAVPPGATRSTSASFRPPSGAGNGANGTFTLRAEAREDPQANDEASASASVSTPRPTPLVHVHQVLGTAGGESAHLAASCARGPAGAPRPGESCAPVPARRAFACSFQGDVVVVPGASLSVHFFQGDGRNATRTITSYPAPGGGFAVAGVVPPHAHTYAVQVTGLAVAKTIACEFRGA